MKYIFLDLDGVINTSASWRVRMYDIKASCIEALAALVNKTSARLIVTSSWKTGYDTRDYEACTPQIKALLDVLRPYGVTLYDKTPDWKSRTREEEISAYLNRNPADHYVILDDDPTLYAAGNAHLYLVDAAVGLGQKDIKNIEKILMK